MMAPDAEAPMDPRTIAAVLDAHGMPVPAATLDAVVRWHTAWLREWHRAVDAGPDLPAELPPAPLWCWPP